MEALIALVLIIVLITIGLLYSSLSWGFVLYKFWGWFLIDNFQHSFLTQITFIQAVGLMFIINLFKNHNDYHKDENIDKNKMWANIVLNPWIALICGWIIKSLLM